MQVRACKAQREASAAPGCRATSQALGKQYFSVPPQTSLTAPPLLRKALSVHAGSSLEPLIGGGRNALLGSVITGVSADVAFVQLKSLGLESELPLMHVLMSWNDDSPVPEQSDDA